MDNLNLAIIYNIFRVFHQTCSLPFLLNNVVIQNLIFGTLLTYLKNILSSKNQNYNKFIISGKNGDEHAW